MVWRTARSAQQNSSTAEPPLPMVPPVPAFPALPRPAAPFDWCQRALDYDAFVYDWSSQGRYGTIQDDPTHYNVSCCTYKMPSYLGDNRVQVDGTQEAVNQVASVIGATLLGVDKSRQDGHNYVDMLRTFFHPALGVALNMPAPDVPGSTAQHGGDSYWYATAANVLYFMLGALYPTEKAVVGALSTIAERYYNLGEALGGEDGNFDGTGFDFKAMITRWNSHRDNEGGDGATGIAAIGLWAHARSGDKRYLQLAKWAMGYLERSEANLFYEVLPLMLPYLAARMNAEFEARYDVQKYIGWVLAGSVARPGWGTLDSRWGGHDVHGLIGSRTDGGGYAFAMNSFATAFLAPAVKYDYRLANLVGNWLHNVANASRFFYADQISPNNQFYGDQFISRPEHVVAYEGLRNAEGGRVPCATGDPERYGHDWGMSPGVTNLGLYGSSWAGLLGATVSATNVPSLQRIDLNALDFFAKPSYPTYLYCNPTTVGVEIAIELEEAVDVYDAVSDRVVLRDASGRTRLWIGPGSSLVAVMAPPGGKVRRVAGKTMIDDIAVRYAGNG